ncbi:MAG: molybdate ABC transporter permease subunit [Deltaproteobacteria bacterium]|nr:molybdate ABC transporter permease subunit [Deltaproteobacteria bacterium]
MMDLDLLSILAVSARIALAATFLAALPALPLALWIARHDFRGRSFLLGLLNLPLVLPPVVVGFLLLVLLSRQGWLGSALVGAFGARVIFTWVAAAVAAAVIAFPLILGGMRIAFEGVDRRLEDAARSLGESPGGVFMRVTLPLAARGLIGALALGLGRCVGEFGATLMVAGNIPGKTQTLALAIHQQAELGHDAQAGALVLIAVAIGLASTWGVERLRARAAP